MRNLYLFITFCLLVSAYSAFSQDEIDIVDPYQMKVSRSKTADTFYFTQNAVTNIAAKQKLDTLRTYDVFLEERPTPFGKAYMCNGTEVTKQKYFEYKQFWNASGACKPCLLYTFDDKNQLKHIAYQYVDCLCGSYVEYYQDGTVKVEGQFKPNPTNDWQNLKGRDLCNIREGLWKYYLPNAAIEKIEKYENGKLKDTNTSPASSLKNKKTTVVVSENEEGTKKGWIQRMKDKSKQNEN